MHDELTLTWQFVSVVVAIISAYSGVVLLAVGYMLNGQRRHNDSLISGLSKQLTTGQDEFRKLERELLDLKIDLPERYVLRTDWIRFASVIDAKQDTLNEKMSNTNEKFERLLIRMNEHE